MKIAHGEYKVGSGTATQKPGCFLPVALDLQTPAGPEIISANPKLGHEWTGLPEGEA